MFLDDQTFQTIMENSIITTVDVIFVKEGKEILLGLRNNKPLEGVYYLPGGRIEKGETILEAVKRKMKSELNFQINENRLVFLKNYDDFFDESIYEGVTLQNISITYVYPLDSSELEQFAIYDTQHSDLHFFSMDDPTLLPKIQERVKDLRSLGM